MSMGGCRINTKIGKKNNTLTATMIYEVLERYDYKNHNQDEVKRNYVQVVDEEIVGAFDYDVKRLKRPAGNHKYIENIETSLRAHSPYYSTPDAKGRYHKISNNNALLREMIFYLPASAGNRFREDENLYKSWCDDNLAWFRNEFPTFKIIASVGHYTTEKTPHMQVLFLPLDEQGKLNNTKYFYDKTADGKLAKTGKIRQSEREQSYIRNVLHKYDIEGGKRGSTAKHRDLSYYASELTHQIDALETERTQLQEAYQSLNTGDTAEYARLKRDNDYFVSFLERLVNLLYSLQGKIPGNIIGQFIDLIDGLIRQREFSLNRTDEQR